jgi:hypothetical protein
LHRLVWGAPVLFVEMLTAAIVPVLLAPWFVRGPHRIWWIATAVMAVAFWFGPSSASHYSPLPLLDRMAMPIVPFALATAALASDAALALISRTMIRRALVALVAAGLAVPMLWSAWRIVRKGTPERDVFAAIRADVARTHGTYVIACGDTGCPGVAAFYFGFEPPPNVKINTPPPLDAAVVRLVINHSRTHDPDPDPALPVWSRHRHVTVFTVRDSRAAVR